MKTFRQFIKDKIPSIPSPIHFKHVAGEDDEDIPSVPFPIHFKHVINKIKEKIPNIPMPIHFKRSKKDDLTENVRLLDWLEKNDNEHIKQTATPPKDDSTELNPHNFSDKEEHAKHFHVTNELTKHHQLSDDEKNNIHDYTTGSSILNKALIHEPKTLRRSERSKMYHIDSAISRHPLKHEVHTFSGVGFDPETLKNKSNKFRSPAYISTSLRKRTAYNNTKQLEGHDYEHIIHFHLKPGDHALAISPYSKYKTEHEILVKRGQIMQHHGTDVDEGRRIKIHHVSLVQPKKKS